MERFVFEVIEPFINKDIEEQSRKEILEKIIMYTKQFIRGELGPINKELSKKSRQLFLATTDIETFKEQIQSMQTELNKLRAEVALKQSEILKQKMRFMGETQLLNEDIAKVKKDIRNTIQKYDLEIQRINDSHKDKLYDLKKQHKSQLQTQLNKERTFWQSEVQSMKETYAQERQTMISENSKERSGLIKKYDQKIYKLKSQTDEMVQKTINDCNAKMQSLKKASGEFLNKLTMQESKSRQLQLQLEKEIGQHRLFQNQFKSTFNELEEYRRRNTFQMDRMKEEYESTIFRLKKSEKDISQLYKQLQIVFKETTSQKDQKFQDTVELMNTDHLMEIQALENNLMQQRQLAITNIQIKNYEQMFKQTKKYQSLMASFDQLKQKYTDVKETYQKRLTSMRENHESESVNLILRKEYEYELSDENSKRQYNNLLTKFNLQIRSLKAHNEVNQENILKKAQEEKIALTNKLIGQYEGMLSDQRSNTEVQIKQKLLQFQRKGKAYQKRINQSEKRKLQLKVTIERMKIQSQMKIESMMQVNEKLQEQTQGLHERILELEKTKSVLINDYEFQLLLLKNEIEKTKEQCIEKEDELRANLNEKIIVKNKEIAKFAEKIKQETEELLKKNKDRVVAIQKQYDELKRVINQKTSLPEDIQALKTFHAAYLQKENELLSQRRKRQELQRELHSKDAIQKVFVSKQAFRRLTVIDKISSTTGSHFFNHHHKHIN